MAPSEWDRFYCSSVEHRGLHCPSCMTDEEYSGQPVYDDKCCCLSQGVEHGSAG